MKIYSFEIRCNNDGSLASAFEIKSTSLNRVKRVRKSVITMWNKQGDHFHLTRVKTSRNSW